MATLFGFNVIEKEYLTIRVPARKHKKKRIQKKWIKKYGFIDKPRPDFIVDNINRCIYVHPETAKKIYSGGCYANSN